MEAVAPNATEWPRPLAWLRDFLKEELAPYPGRGAFVARMVIAATLVMLISMTFRLPFGVQAIYALAISRETHWATVRAVRMAILMMVVAAGYVIVGTMISLGDPMLRVLWVIATLFIAFLGIRIIADYATALAFGILAGVTIPVLDQHISTELKVEHTLWAAGQTILAAMIAGAVALLFAGLKPGDLLIRSIAERLAGVEDLFNCCAGGYPVKENTAKKITRLAMLGTSSLRRTIRRSGYSPHYAEQMGVVVALVGRLVDIAASSVPLVIGVPDEERKRIQRLVQTIAGFRADLQAGRIPGSSQYPVANFTFATTPLLPEAERTVALMAEVFAGSKSLSAYAPPLSDEGDPPQRFFVRDVLSNPEHIKFAAKGCLAASLCYLTYMALGWPGISTAVVTCMLTALTTIGASRQKQVLRITGALAGAAISLAAQIFLLPSMDSIAGFTLLFILVTFVAAWIATSSPRPSYFGIQVANAYYIVNLQDFYSIQTSLVPARDRIVGIMLGLLMMWLVFDQLWGAPAIAEMKRAFFSLLRSLAKLAREPVAENPQAAIEQTYALRETINNSFDKVRALSDAVLFEFGPTHQQDLAWRSSIRAWQPQLRMLFITRVALLKYRLRLPGFELPQPVRLAQHDFDEHLAKTLERMADGLEGKPSNGGGELQAAFAQLRQTVRASSQAVQDGLLAPEVRTFTVLSERITSLAHSLAGRIQNSNLPTTKPSHDTSSLLIPAKRPIRHGVPRIAPRARH